jgi:hypothetical protein
MQVANPLPRNGRYSFVDGSRLTLGLRRRKVWDFIPFSDYSLIELVTDRIERFVSVRAK